MKAVEKPIQQNHIRSSCLYILDKKILIKKNRFLKENTKLDSLFKDPTIEMDIKGFRKISLKPWGINRVLYVYNYVPKAAQSCYTNSFNIFGVERNIRDLPFKANKIKYSDKPLLIDQNLNEINYEADLSVKNFNKKYVIYDQFLKTPFDVGLKLVKRKDRYVLKVSFNLYSYLPDQKDLFNLNSLKLTLIETKGGPTNSSNGMPFDIIKPQSWISKHSIRKIFVNKIIWFKEIILPLGLELKNNGFYFDLFWSASFPNKTARLKCCYSNSISLF